MFRPEFQKDLYKTKVCKFWDDKGECPRGDRCTFAHGDAELREAPPEYDGRRRSPPPPRFRDDRYSPRREDRFRDRERFDERSRRPPDGPRSRRSRSPPPLDDRDGAERRRSRDGSERPRDREHRSPSTDAPFQGPARPDGDGPRPLSPPPRGRYESRPRPRHSRGPSPTPYSPRSADDGRPNGRGGSESPRGRAKRARRHQHPQDPQAGRDLDRQRMQVALRELEYCQRALRERAADAEEVATRSAEARERLEELTGEAEERERRFGKYLPAILHLYERLHDDFNASIAVPVVPVAELLSPLSYCMEDADLEGLKFTDLVHLEVAFFNAITNINTAKQRQAAKAMDVEAAEPAAAPAPSRWTLLSSPQS